jgi:hypothetical protein
LSNFVAANKVALESVAVPAREDERLAVVTQDLLRELGNVIPTIRNVDGKILSTNIFTVGIYNADLVLGDGGSAHTNKNGGF